MEIYEITGFKTGISQEGVNYLQPSDSFQNIQNGYIHRQILQSRKGFSLFSGGKLTDGSRIMGIFEHIKPDNTSELLVCTKEFLYKYDGGTNLFVQLANSGAAPVGGFGIVSDHEYVSGTTYPFADGTQRFVFTSQGMSDIYFYDGTDVKSFTTIADNPDYEEPPEGTLRNAWIIFWFAERLLLFNPTIASQPNPQTVLFSGIRNADGNGDKFNVVSSGRIVPDTYEYFNGASILGDIVIMHFNRSNWVIEKRADKFNPFFTRKIPSVLGTDAPFSTVNWYDEIKSLGKTGLITTDGRRSNRFDNKIPDFTRDEIDQDTFNLTYGGFDRENGQFLFSYPDGTNPDNTQNKVLVYNYEEDSWSIYDQRFSVFGQTIEGQFLTWDEIEATDEHPSWAEWDTTEEIWDKIGVEDEVQKTLAGDNDGFVYQLNQDYNDYTSSISAITQASNAVLTIADRSFKPGDIVVISSVEGMTEINNYDQTTSEVKKDFYEVVSATGTTVTINLDTTEYDAYTQGGLISKLIDFRAETIPFNPYRSEGRACYISHVEFLLDANNGFLKVDVLMDEEDVPFKSDVLVKPTTQQKLREWVSMSVNQEANFFTFVLKQQNPGTQVKLTSMRLHIKRGSKTSG